MTIRVAVEHQTKYTFARPVKLWPHTIRLRPAPHSRTPIDAYSLSISPRNHFINWQQDPFGNYLARVVFPEPVRELEITVDVVADMTVINPFDFFVEEYAERFPFAYPADLRADLEPYLRPVGESDSTEPGPVVRAWVERNIPLAGADAVIVNHVSNVFGCVQPLEEIAGVCRSRGVPLLVDASQSAGTLPLHLTELGAAFIAMPGHKGLYGPQGTGLLLCGERPARPLLLGGTGSASRDRQMPPTLPDRLEAGTHNMPGIAGLLEGLRFVRRRTPEAIACRERQLAAEAVRRLKALPGVEVFTPANGPHPTGVVSFRAAGRDCEELAEALGRRGIALRAGLHCAPLAHRTAGTLDTGTVRLSLSDFNTPAQIEKLAQELHQLFRETVR